MTKRTVGALLNAGNRVLKTIDAARLDPKDTTTDADDDERPVTKRDFKESRPATSRGDGTKTR